MKKRMLALLMSAVVVAGLAACGGDDGAVSNNENDNQQAEQPEDTEGSGESEGEGDTEGEGAGGAEDTAVKPTEPTGQVVIGSGTAVENDWYDTAYENSAFNYKAYSLIHSGGDTIIYNKEGQFEVNPTVVKNLETTENEDGSKTFTITINDGLLWSDGTPITAKDYVFEILLDASPEMAGVDSYPNTWNYTHVVGIDEYYEGADTLAGVHLVDDMTFSITAKAEELPFHYDITYATAMPRPMAVIAPGCDVVDAPEGVSITGEFTTDVLMKTINDPDTGYRFNPQVTCGPYLFKGYDTAAQQATLEVNPNFAGDYRGVKPLIKTLILKTVKEETMVDELKAGTVDILFQTGGKTIEAGLDLVDEGAAIKNAFFRNGYGMISFDCSQFPTDSANVRKAIALCLDRNEFARQYSGGHASVVHSEYGLAQWEYMEAKDWIDENLDTYDMDLDRAKQLLVEDGWTLNKDGGEYKDGDGLRYKDVDGERKALQIEWCNSEGNPVSELLATMLPEAMAEIGMELLPTTVDSATLFDARGHQTEKLYNMYNLGNGFATAYSPWYYYSSDDQWMGSGYNSTWIKDQELNDVTNAMKSIPYEDTEAWLEKWKEFVKAFNDKMPNIPLYSDEYHDFLNPRIHDWESTSIWEWNSAILDAWVAE